MKPPGLMNRPVRVKRTAMSSLLQPDWQVTPGLMDYPSAVADMEDRARAIARGEAAERIWMVEHAPLYTAGTSADAAELLDARFPVHPTGRGGRYTYHGPGQRVTYVQLDLSRRGRDVRRYVAALESWAVAALGRFGVAAYTVPGRVGVWTCASGEEGKIGAIGVRISRWVTLHGFAVNIDPDLTHFTGIVPCGLQRPVTSLAAATEPARSGHPITMANWDAALQRELPAFLSSVTHRSQESLERGKEPR